MASDGRFQGKPTFDGFSLSLTTPNEAEADRLFAALADDGQVQLPLSKTLFFSELRDGHRSVRRAMDGYRATSISRLISSSSGDHRPIEGSAKQGRTRRMAYLSGCLSIGTVSAPRNARIGEEVRPRCQTTRKSHVAPASTIGRTATPGTGTCLT